MLGKRYSRVDLLYIFHLKKKIVVVLLMRVLLEHTLKLIHFQIFTDTYLITYTTQDIYSTK